MFKSLLKLQQRRRRRPHRQRDHDVGRPVARRPIPIAERAVAFHRSGRGAAARRSPVSSAPRCRPTCRCSESGRATAMSRRRDRGRHRCALQARGSGVFHDARHPDRSRARLHERAIAPARRGSSSSTNRWRASWRSAFGVADPKAVGRPHRQAGTRPTRTAARSARPSDIEIVGVIRNERVERSRVADAGRRLRVAGAGAAPGDQAHRPDARRSSGRDARAFARLCGRSIRTCRSATSGPWRRSSS